MKSKKHIIFIGITLFSIFNVIAFAIPTEFTASFWVAYVFMVVAFGISIFVWMTYCKTNKSLKSKFLNIPILNVCILYTFIQLVAFIIFKFWYMLPVWISIVNCAIILGVALIFMFSLDPASDYIELVEEKAKSKVFLIKTLQSDVEMIAGSISDSEIKKQVLDLAESIRFSDPMSDSSLSDIEAKTSEKVDELKSSAEVDMKPLIIEIQRLLLERNKKCKILK